ncbi:hypothetical protein LPJ70_000098 [Coemansia sp. RSA 2708]|nr:hypothetical protein LPJ70_000098 [Coemansia sp. RSA 2708]
MSHADDASERTLNGESRASTDTAGLYNVLGVDRDATPDELKRAYRRLALQHHPDRNPGASGRSGEFVRIQYAYDVLSDERRRRIYNRYGEIGVQMAGRMGGELLDPLVSSLLSTFAFASAAVALLLIAFFALLARRIDHANDWLFSVIFTPLWTADVLVLLVLMSVRLKDAALIGSGSSQSTDDSTSEQLEQDEMEEAAVDGEVPADPCPAPPTDTTPLLGAENSGTGPQQQQQQQQRRHRPSIHRRRRRLRTVRRCAEARVSELATATPMLYLLLLAGFQISLVLYLDGYVDWTIMRVAAPWFCIEAIHFVLLTLQLTAGLLRIKERALLSNDNPRRSTAKPMLVLAADTYWWLVIRVALALLVAAKLAGPLAAWSWALIFAPAYLPAVRWAAALFFLRQQLRAMSGDAEVLQNENAIVLACAAAFGIVSSFVYSFVALLVWKLSQPLAVRLALVLIPVFIALSLACCCCSCFGLCLTYGIEATVENEMFAGQDACPPCAAVVPTNRRIERPPSASDQ